MAQAGNIMLVSFGNFGENLPGKIAEDIGNEFRLPVFAREGHLDLSEFYNPKRNQYDANLLLKEIHNHYAENTLKTIGLFNVDLFIPILTFLFGQALLNGNTGIVSVYRLRNERYGMKPDEQLFLDRIRKEVIHELGHTFGLIHCNRPECVMRSSTYVEDIDQKSHRLCMSCLKLVEKNLKIVG
jgi:archaemetzincin